MTTSNTLKMDNQFGLKQSDLISIITILKSQREVEEAILFGSRAKGDYTTSHISYTTLIYFDVNPLALFD